MDKVWIRFNVMCNGLNVSLNFIVSPMPCMFDIAHTRVHMLIPTHTRHKCVHGYIRHTLHTTHMHAVHVVSLLVASLPVVWNHTVLCVTQEVFMDSP